MWAKLLLGISLFYLSFTQVQQGATTLLTGHRSSMIDELLAFAILALSMKEWRRIWTGIRGSLASGLLIAWIGVGLIAVLASSEFSKANVMALGYMAKNFPLLFAYFAFSEKERPSFMKAILVTLLATHLVSGVYAFMQESVRLQTELYAKDFVAGLVMDANLAGVAFAIGLFALYALRAIPNTNRWFKRLFYPMVIYFLLCQSFTFSRMSWFVLFAMFIPLEIMRERANPSGSPRPTLRASLRGFALILFFLATTETYIVFSFNEGLKRWFDVFLDFDFEDLRDDHTWLLEAQSASTGTEGSLFTKYRLTFDYLSEKKGQVWLGLGPGNVNFPALEGKATPIYNKDFDRFIESRNSNLSPWTSVDFLIWTVEWGYFGALMFTLISMMALMIHFIRGNIFETFALGMGVAQIFVHDYYFAYLMGPLVVLALGQVRMASIRSELVDYFKNWRKRRRLARPIHSNSPKNLARA